MQETLADQPETGGLGFSTHLGWPTWCLPQWPAPLRAHDSFRLVAPRHTDIIGCGAKSIVHTDVFEIEE